MKMIKRYVVNSRLRLTTGMVVSGIGAIALGWAVFMLLWEYSNGVMERYTSSDYFVRIAGFAIFIFFIWLGRYADKKQEWPDYIIEVYDDGWIHYQLKYRDSDYRIRDCWIPMDKIVGIGKYKKIYYKKKGKWYILLDFGFTDGEKVYGPFFNGWLIEPKDIKEIDSFVEMLKKLGERNRKKIKIKIPHSVNWYGISTWEESDEAQKIKDEREKMLEGMKEGA